MDKGLQHKGSVRVKTVKTLQQALEQTLGQADEGSARVQNGVTRPSLFQLAVGGRKRNGILTVPADGFEIEVIVAVMDDLDIDKLAIVEMGLLLAAAEYQYSLIETVVF